MEVKCSNGLYFSSSNSLEKLQKAKYRNTVHVRLNTEAQVAIMVKKEKGSGGGNKNIATKKRDEKKGRKKTGW